MSNLVWLGDSDPEAQSVTLGEVTFVKGVSTPVKDKALYESLSENPMFSKDAKAEVAQADEPSEEEQAERAEQGTVKAALRRQLSALGVTVKGNASEETLRAKLVEATK
jgi:hypothetical protein